MRLLAGFVDGGLWPLFTHATPISWVFVCVLAGMVFSVGVAWRGRWTGVPTRLGLVALLAAATLPGLSLARTLDLGGYLDSPVTIQDLLVPIMRWSVALVAGAGLCAAGFGLTWWLSGRSARRGAAVLVLLCVSLLSACAPDDLPWRDGRSTDEARLAAAIRSGDSWTRTLAISDARPWRLRSGLAVPALREAITDADPAIRAGVLHALGEYGPNASEALEDVVAALDDDHPVVRRTAARTLGRMGCAARGAPVDALARMRAADPDVYVRVAAAHAHDALACSASIVLHPKERASHDATREEMVRMHIAADGIVVIKCERYTFEQLRTHLFNRANSCRECEPPMFSKISLSVTLTRSLPWSVVRMLFAACAHPDVGITRIGFGGAFAWTRVEDQIRYQPTAPDLRLLPLEDLEGPDEPPGPSADWVMDDVMDDLREEPPPGVRPPGTPAPASIRVDVTVRIGYATPPSSAGDVWTRVVALREIPRFVGIGLIVDPAVPCGEIFEILNVLREAGFHRIRAVDEGEILADYPRNLVKRLRPGPSRRAGVVIE